MLPTVNGLKIRNEIKEHVFRFDLQVESFFSTEPFQVSNEPRQTFWRHQPFQTCIVLVC